MQQLQNSPFFSQFRQRLQAKPNEEVEDSLWFRILVQLLVVVGIIATDVAAETSISLWAVPASILGATWSWYQRRKRNIPVKFCIAIGMLLALASFLWNLRDSLNDTRLILGELLIQLQVLHSFDLPRRKDLGYSMVIGLILLGVAATLSQTMAFAPLLLLFLAIALPALVLDYRARLGLKPITISRRKKEKIVFPFSLKRLSVLLLVVVGLGLSIFAFLPRVPGYQLRTFPVSSPIELTENFDPSNINNPAYNRGRNSGEGNGRGLGSNREKGAGELDDTFYYGFNAVINQNLRGIMKPQTVMRVRSQAEGFWRVMAFDKYNGQGWEVSRNKQTQTIDRPSWSFQFILPTLATLSRTQEVVQTYTVVSEMPNIIPALSQPRQVYFPTQQIAMDAERSLRSPVGLNEGLTYTVISDVALRDRTALGKASTDYPENVKKYYLQVPEAIKEKVRKRTEQILVNQQKVSKSNKKIASNYEKALYLAQYLKQNPNYKIEGFPPFLEENEDLVEAFLFGYKNSPANKTITGGYADHFTTVYTIMLRSIGIPARVAAGFSPGTFNPFTGLYIVKNTDAHLLTEVYFPNYGWFAFDPIPGHPLIPPSVNESQSYSLIERFWKWIAGWLPSPVTGFLNTVFGAIAAALFGAIAWFFGLFAQGWTGLFFGSILTIILAFVAWLAWQGWQMWRYHLWLRKLPAMESIYQQMLKWLKEKGLRKHPAQTPLEYVHEVSSHCSAEGAEAIAEISQAYISWRYGGENPNLKRLKRRLQDLQKTANKRIKR
ncbi:transglutaminaseTgpA domain-containing protein [Aerosakkonemataceae cyanobacterium BLCC-F154]|uniref:TransglutaminaseTgpA domain-containing protein n=1 Tax=Floridaenema fluviatile BLCC-F154 TaxID=3153640 RepID=A0ABV4YJ64_9CYAN